MKVSVIIPVYNIVKFIGKCADSLMQQTLDDVEYIFVNDASTDGSIGILESVLSSYPEKASSVRILHHDKNKGLPSARNTGLKAATGEYIFHCDGDDWVEADMLQALYRKAKESDADMVWCDWWLSFENNERLMKQPDLTSVDEAIRAMLCGSMKYNVWNKLAKRDLYDGILFPEGKSMGEDMTMICVASKAKKVAYKAGAYYHYRRTNTEALTQNYSEKKLNELKYNTQHTIEYLKANRNSSDIDTDIHRFCLNVKLPFLFTGDGNDIRRWREWFPGANKCIMGNKDQALRTRILQWCAANKLDWVIKSYYMVVYKTIYGVLYR